MPLGQMMIIQADNMSTCVHGEIVRRPVDMEDRRHLLILVPDGHYGYSDNSDDLAGMFRQARIY